MDEERDYHDLFKMLDDWVEANPWYADYLKAMEIYNIPMKYRMYPAAFLDETDTTNELIAFESTQR